MRISKIVLSLVLVGGLLAPGTSMAAAPAYCQTTSLLESSTCPFQGIGRAGFYDVTAISWSIYHLAEVDGQTVRVDDLSSGDRIIPARDSGTHIWMDNTIYHLEVTNGAGRAGNAGQVDPSAIRVP